MGKGGVCIGDAWQWHHHRQIISKVIMGPLRVLRCCPAAVDTRRDTMRRDAMRQVQIPLWVATVLNSGNSNTNSNNNSSRKSHQSKTSQRGAVQSAAVRPQLDTVRLINPELMSSVCAAGPDALLLLVLLLVVVINTKAKEWLERVFLYLFVLPATLHLCAKTEERPGKHLYQVGQGLQQEQGQDWGRNKDRARLGQATNAQ